MPRTKAFSFELGNAVSLFLLTFSFCLWNGSIILSDQDTYWHIVVGEWIWGHQAVPHFDQYSHTMAGAPWIAKEWLSQLFFYAAYTNAGWYGVVLFTAVIACLSYVFLFSWLCRRVNPLVALTMTAVSLSFSMNSLLARPQVFFFLFLTVCVCGLASAVEAGKTPWWLAPLVALWANLHASFPIAIVLAAAFALQAVAAAEKSARMRLGARWALATLAAALAMGATPYGFGPLQASFAILGDKTTDFIDEWRPVGFNLHGLYAFVYIVGSFAILAAARSGWTKAATIAGPAYMMIRHVRFFTVFGIVAPVELATPVARRFPRFAAKNFSPNALATNVARWVFGFACILAALTLAFTPRPTPSAKVSPAAALQAARRDGAAGGKVFNDYGFGGYLIFNHVKTFIDGRTELYFNGLFAAMRDAETSANDGDFLALLNKHQVTWALVVHGDDGALKLRRSNDWKLIYEDEFADVLVRK